MNFNNKAESLVESSKINFKKISLIIIIALLPLSSYNIIAIVPLFLIFSISKYNKNVLFVFFIFLFLVSILLLTNFNLTNYKYLISLISLLFLISIQNQITVKLFKITTIILILFVILEISPLRDLMRFFYRSGNEDLHYDRYSCFFLFPGDLGAYCAIAISIHVLDIIIQNSTKPNISNYIFIAINFFILILSQSRMALFHLFITISILFINKPKYSVYLLFVIPLIFLLKDNLSYLFREDFIELALSFFSSDASDSNKRSQEIFEILNSSESEIGYFEGSLPSLIYRFGFIFSFLILIVLLIFTNKFWKKIKFKKKSLIVIMPIIITSFISAPLERPKLLLYSFSAILLTFNLLSDDTNKKVYSIQ